MKYLAAFVRKVNKFRHFESFRDARLFFQILLLWGVLPCLLLLPLRTVLRLLTPPRLMPVAENVARHRYQKIVHFARYWFRWKWIAGQTTCLKTSLLLYYFLSRAGIPTRICFGVQKNGDHLCGHSWLETSYPDLFPPECTDDFCQIYMYPESPVEIFTSL